MKCSQCCCTDLVEVEFPQEAQLIQVSEGLSGYSYSYNIENNVFCNSYICVNCGHFEFFNTQLAEQIKHNRKVEEEIKNNIKTAENEIQELNDEAMNIRKTIEKLRDEASNLDITLRRNNEIQESISSLKKNLTVIDNIIKEKYSLINNLKNQLSK